MPSGGVHEAASAPDGLKDDFHQDPPHTIAIECKNITSLVTHEAGMAKRSARLSIIQEHSAPWVKCKEIKERLRTDYQRHLVAGPTEPHNPNNAGVGAIARSCDTLFEFTPVTPNFAKVREAGRAIHLGYGLGKHGRICSFFNVYGHSGGASDPQKAKCTSLILQACMQEMLHFNDLPNFLMGDLNGTFTSFEELGALVNTMGWRDLNSIADTWNQPVNRPTCLTALSNQPTIRSYCLACPLALPLVKGFTIIDEDLCPVHSTLRINLDLKITDAWVHQAQPKRPLSDLLNDAFQLRYGVGPLKPDLQFFAEEVADVPADGHHCSDDDDDPKLLNRFIKQQFGDAYKQASSTYHCRRDHFNHQAKRHMDKCLATCAPLLDLHLRSNNTTLFWKTFWSTIEAATIAFTADAHGHQDLKLFKGRGDYPVSLVKQKVPRANQSKEGCTLHSPDWLTAFQHQSNRCKFAADNLAVLTRGKVDAQGKAAIEDKVKLSVKKIVSFLRWQTQHGDECTLPPCSKGPLTLDPQGLIDKLNDEKATNFSRIFALKKETKRYDRFIASWQDHFSKQQIERNKEPCKWNASPP